MTSSIADKLTELLRAKSPVAEAKDDPKQELPGKGDNGTKGFELDKQSDKMKSKDEDPLKEFKEFITVINKEFGKDNIINIEGNNQLLIVRMTRNAYESNQIKFQVKGREEWLNDNGMAILSIMQDVEPESTKIYFTKIQTLNATE